MNLNSLKKIKKIDTGRMAESLASLPAQIKNVWQEAESIKMPAGFSEIDKVVVFGMGGSNLGARIITSVFKEELKVPVIIEAGYDVPGCVDENTLCIISSYSGGTEEPLSVMAELKKKKAKLFALGASSIDSALEKIAIEESVPGLFFDVSDNPSGQPRAGLGYALFGLLAIFAKIKILKINSKEIEELIKKISACGKQLDINVKNNPAKKMAQKLSGRGVIIFGGDFLEGNLHTLRNQFNENSKNFSAYLVLPEMNHYALEGLSFPKAIKNNLIFIAFNSGLYGERVGRRLELTKQVVKKNKIKLIECSLVGESKLLQAVEMLQFGAWLTFYRGLLNNIDPSLISWVDWFKEELGS